MSLMIREHLFDENGRKSKRGLIKEKKPGPAHQRPGNGEHLLLASGKGSGALTASFEKPWKVLLDAFQVFRDAVPVSSQEGSEGEIVLDRHVGEKGPALGALSNAQFYDRPGLLPMDRLGLIKDLPPSGPKDARDREEGG